MPRKRSAHGGGAVAGGPRSFPQLTAEEEGFLAARTPAARLLERMQVEAQLTTLHAKSILAPDDAALEAQLFRTHHPEAERWQRDPDGVDDPDDRYPALPPHAGQPVTNRHRLDRLLCAEWPPQRDRLPEWQARARLLNKRRRLEHRMQELTDSEPARWHALRAWADDAGAPEVPGAAWFLASLLSRPPERGRRTKRLRCHENGAVYGVVVPVTAPAVDPTAPAPDPAAPDGSPPDAAAAGAPRGNGASVVKRLRVSLDNDAFAPYDVFVLRDGTYRSSPVAGVLARDGRLWLRDAALRAPVADAFARIDRSPLQFFGEVGRRAGICCVCGRALTDGGSVGAGLGPVCAEHVERAQTLRLGAARSGVSS